MLDMTTKIAKRPTAKRKESSPRLGKTPSMLRDIVAANVRKMLIYKYGQMAHRQWAEKTGISLGTIGRALRGESGVTLETLEIISNAVDLSPYQLLVEIPDPGNPSIVLGATADERQLWEQFLDLRKKMAGR